MRVKKLTLRNFRNIGETTFYPERNLNFLIGSNGQGKTSVLEALGYLAHLRSFRSAKTDQVIHWGTTESEVACTIVPEVEADWEADLKVVFLSSPSTGATSKTAFINGKAYKSSTQYLSQRFGSFELGFHAVVFNPSDHDLVRGEPAIRRAYMDRVLAAEDMDYLKCLQRYQRALQQRNAVLKSMDRPDRELLRDFASQMAEHGTLLTEKRLAWLHRLEEPMNRIIQQIAPRQAEIGLVYSSSWISHRISHGQGALSSIQFEDLKVAIEQAFWVRQSAMEEAELKARSSLVGPHRDDWTFLLRGQGLKGHGSQGEVRSTLLALKLAEIELFRKKTSHLPLLLLDDFSSELDRERREFLMNFLSETDLQVFVTTTEAAQSVKASAGKHYCVSNGVIKDLTTDDHGNQRESVLSG